MNDPIIYAAGYSPAMGCCIQKLKQMGLTICSEPNQLISHLLLPVPSFAPDGTLVGGGDIHTILRQLPKNVVIVGGNLDCEALKDYHTIDLLQNSEYLALNAQITAHCAIKAALNQLPIILDGCKALVIGWGRIGKCLSQLLRQMGADVTVSARKESDRSMIKALGYSAAVHSNIDLADFHLIYNTVPAMLFPECPGGALKIDLASRLGMGGEDVIWARGLPGKDAPESSGQLIADTFLSLLRKEPL